MAGHPNRVLWSNSCLSHGHIWGPFPLVNPENLGRTPWSWQPCSLPLVLPLTPTPAWWTWPRDQRFTEGHHQHRWWFHPWGMELGQDSWHRGGHGWGQRITPVPGGSHAGRQIEHQRVRKGYFCNSPTVSYPWDSPWTISIRWYQLPGPKVSGTGHGHQCQTPQWDQMLWPLSPLPTEVAFAQSSCAVGIAAIVLQHGRNPYWQTWSLLFRYGESYWSTKFISTSTMWTISIAMMWATSLITDTGIPPAQVTPVLLRPIMDLMTADGKGGVRTNLPAELFAGASPAMRGES